ncbi:GntT/GntP/DsdX family permease [Tanticharoenia sakaeratensis]|uniref:Gluconate transporter family protein n=1 Tax=Tanticharoenia sakaeratensis NBRC 103193 TaxID=1231623 RepID=A0A0D6MLC1_9PROT|nr:gluconate:H+ symporter [Tanticharoenia sakaeratensis]GAN54452.1 gluconate transporter family protein [Tanticharoenia sakaeratensis NBRC 103193]GBQ24166.1 H+/gluconate symporter [Tanticharoenia sakaeratensis NBRC 103193]
MSPVLLMASAVSGIVLMLVLIIRFKLQPILTLLIVSIVVALLAGMPAAKIVPAIEAGMGKTMGHIAIIIALGAMIGKIVEISGGAEILARDLIARFGDRRIPLALTLAGFLIGVPVFFEVGVIMVMPLLYGVSNVTKRSLMVFALPMCVAMLTVHSFLPPHPGPTAAAAQIGADMGRILTFGVPVTLFVCLAGYFISKRMTRRDFTYSANIQALIRGLQDGKASETSEISGHALPDAQAPAFWLIVGLILFPIALIMCGTTLSTILPTSSPYHGLTQFLGSPVIALLSDTLLAGYCLGLRRGWSFDQVSSVIGSAVPGVAMVILIAGCGGVFGNILVESGIGHVISDTLRGTGLPILALAFILSLVLRAVQGSTTVALVTTAGILGPLVSEMHFGRNRLALLTLAMGGGGLSASHVNDAGFWIFTKLTGIEVADSLKTWTVLTTTLGVLGFLVTSVLWPFFS